METTIDTKSTITLFDRAHFSYKILFFDIVTTIGYALSPVMNKSLRAALVKICTISEGDSFLDHIITSDETWCHHYELESKRQSMEWRHVNSPSKKKFKVLP